MVNRPCKLIPFSVCAFSYKRQPAGVEVRSVSE